MKFFTLSFSIFFILLVNTGFANSIDNKVIDSAQTELNVNDSDTIINEQKDTTSIKEEPQDAADKNHYDYNQIFMFGFLILGALLVVWKYK